jgi:ABC-2 type transport system permease protein
MTRVALSIARRDFMGYLATPKAGVVFLLFLMFLGIIFGNYIGMYNEAYMKQQMGGETPNLNDFLRAMFLNLNFILLFIIPAVTMGSFADEIRTHSAKLLYSAPVSSLEIVIGKFLALAAIMGVLLLASSVYPIFLLIHASPDPLMILSAYLGVFLLILSQLAFGMWISALTSSQFFAFLLTVFALFMLMIVNMLAPPESGAAGLAALATYVATPTHLEPFLKGLITVKSAAYFICTTIFFLTVTNIAFDSHRWR